MGADVEDGVVFLDVQVGYQSADEGVHGVLQLPQMSYVVDEIDRLRNLSHQVHHRDDADLLRRRRHADGVGRRNKVVVVVVVVGVVVVWLHCSLTMSVVFYPLSAFRRSGRIK